MWKALISILVIVETTFGATIYHCMDESTCQIQGDHVEADNFEFLSKFTQKQYRSVVSLTMPNASVNKVDPKLKYLKNLQYLDFSYNNVQISSLPSLTNLKILKLNGNNLKYINMTALPQNIENLDISHNLLVQIPKDWRSLRSLKTLHLNKNPVDCDCNNVLNYDRLIKSGVNVPETVMCYSPKKYAAKDIGAVNCSLDDIMLYDEAGSGIEDIFGEENDHMSNVPFVQEKEDENIQDDNTFIDDVPEPSLLAVENTESSLGDTLEEGSGDEGSGFPAMGEIIGCIENCSTPEPVGKNDEAHASPLPSPIDQAKMIIEDIYQFHVTTLPTSTAKPTTTTNSELTTVVEAHVVKKVNTEVQNSPSKSDDVEVMNENAKTGELEKAQLAPKKLDSSLCYYWSEEMKPLSKPTFNSTNEKLHKNSSNLPEHVPLINGQNGKTKDDTPILKTFTPLAHPEALRDEEPEIENLQNNIPDDVEVRQKSIPELLTPQRERVTIKETEIPDSIPKTPLLVHRQRNSDGEIVTTLVP
ncbi:hypothetical protein NQ317_010995 [Molorchus minor]|uniref:Uncharacterized protein n=1 Tax=Molorchus minor TaxID=1323400 RepID=A0ABQ9K2X7_9CUCU|nr:hypothetical protein NQ317_010995 [Molorchus minor]